MLGWLAAEHAASHPLRRHTQNTKGTPTLTPDMMPRSGAELVLTEPPRSMQLVSVGNHTMLRSGGWFYTWRDRQFAW